MVPYRYDSIGETIWRKRLTNGLDIYVVCKPKYGKQFAFLSAHCGSMDLEIHGKDGVKERIPVGTAHYLEHKLFESEDGSVTDAFADNGAEDNAFTSADLTGYYFECNENFEENLRLLLSFVSNPCFTEEFVQRERDIIAQEICMEEDEPYSLLYYKVMKMLYEKHSIGERIAGTEETIGEITADTLRKYYDAFYNPGNMVLCVAGNVDPEAISSVAEEVMPTREVVAVRAEYGLDEPIEAGQEYAEWNMPVSVPLFTIGVKGTPARPGESLKQRFIAELACDALFGPSSELYTRLYDEGLINGAFGGDYEFVPGAAYLLLSGESRDPVRVCDELVREAERLLRNGINEGLWERLKRAAYGAMVRGLNSLENICIELAQTHFDGEDYLDFPKIFHSIEKREVEALLGSWCTRERMALAVVKPGK